MKRIEDFIIKSHHWLNYKNFLIELEGLQDIAPIKPGNFAELQIRNSPDIFLRRPFSVYDADPDRNILTFYIKVIGKGTHLLGEMRIGDKINLLYPLGNSFNIPDGDNIMIVAGGSGLAPFLLLSKELMKHKKKITYLFGGRDSDGIVLIRNFTQFGTVHITTEDGSMGEKGRVTDHSIFKSDRLPFDHIFTCGPEPMMKAVGKIAKSHKISCEASLENIMACGFGVCLTCVVPTADGNKCVCTEGPVFNINNLKW